MPYAVGSLPRRNAVEAVRAAADAERSGDYGTAQAHFTRAASLLASIIDIDSDGRTELHQRAASFSSRAKALRVRVEALRTRNARISDVDKLRTGAWGEMRARACWAEERDTAPVRRVEVWTAAVGRTLYSGN